MNPSILVFKKLLFAVGALVLLGVVPAFAAETQKEMNGVKKATFAGGCFWCMQPVFDSLDGVVSTQVGYTGGKTQRPTYDEISRGDTGHAEAIEIHYDPSRISYRELLDQFWKNIDPTTENRQFQDRGTQYRTAVFYHDEEQKREALASREELQKSGVFQGREIVTEIVPAADFHMAEDYHQDYYKKEPMAYKLYSFASGRKQFLEAV